VTIAQKAPRDVFSDKLISLLKFYTCRLQKSAKLSITFKVKPARLLDSALVKLERPYLDFVTCESKVRDTDLSYLDRVRRSLNREFAQQIIDLIDPCAERSSSSSESTHSSPDGQLIFMHIWLGSELGH
jgi:hypothetical protein